MPPLPAHAPREVHLRSNQGPRFPLRLVAMDPDEYHRIWLIGLALVSMVLRIHSTASSRTKNRFFILRRLPNSPRTPRGTARTCRGFRPHGTTEQPRGRACLRLAFPPHRSDECACMATTYTMTIKTPIELQTPFPLRVKDHRLTLVHDLTGAEGNWLHEVSVRDGDTQVINYLADAGYNESCRWRKDGTQWWSEVLTWKSHGRAHGSPPWLAFRQRVGQHVRCCCGHRSHAVG
jgi:hypothetical protein